MRNNCILRLTSLLFLCFGAIATDAQNDRETAVDTSSKFVKDARAFGRNETDVSLKRYREGKLSMRQRETIKELTFVLEKVQALSHKGMVPIRQYFIGEGG